MLDKFRYSAVYRCHKCNEKMVITRPYVYRVTLHTCCPRCGNSELKKLEKRDRIDEMYSSLISALGHFLGAPLYWCQFCRLQFYDFRPRKTRPGQPRSE